MQDFSSKPMPLAYLAIRTIMTKKCAEAVAEAPSRPETPPRGAIMHHVAASEITMHTYEGDRAKETKTVRLPIS